ncbi:MAG: OmpW family outer membrane protein [Roseiarcus sp.]
MSGFAGAADLTAAAPPPVVAAPSPFFVKLGFTYIINNSTSTLYSQTVDPIPGPGFGSAISPQIQVPGAGANIANVATVGFEAGYYVMPNISLDISAGVPMWAKVSSKGTPTLGVPPLWGNPVNGTTLATIIPSFVPITALYHFNQLGAFQPYAGGGFAPVFSIAQKNGSATGVTVDPTVGLVLQAGADYMIDNHWGLSVDVKRLFADGVTHTTGLAGDPFPVAGTLKTQFNTWTLSTGVVYRF